MTLRSPASSRWIRPAGGLWLGTWLALTTACAPADGGDAPTSPDDVLLVPPPTGAAETDRIRIQATFDSVAPGGTVQFAPGTYVVGEGARLVVPDVTVLGHPDGTVIRSCDPADLEFPTGEEAELNTLPLVQSCTGLFVEAARQTIRGLTFEYAWHGLFVGVASFRPGVPPNDEMLGGGHRIEDNVFRYAGNGIRVVGPTEQPTVIRGNLLQNTFHAIQGNGAVIHVLDNRIEVPDPHGVPTAHHPESAVILNEWGIEGAPCTGSLIQGNVVEGTMNGIQVWADPGQTCSGHEIRDNEIRIGEVPLPEAYPQRLRDLFFGEGAVGSVVAGVAIRLVGQPAPGADMPAGRVTGVVVEGNRVNGGSGLGIQLLGASDNRILGNHITGIGIRDPLDGPTWGDDPTAWAAANGSGIWISEGSDANHFEGNTFDDLAGPAIHIDGADNEVVVVDAGTEVDDRGRDNRIGPR